MSKKKRNKTTKGRFKGSVADTGWERAWSDIEEAFFATAPPDQAEPPAPPESFDDLDLVPVPSGPWDRGSGRVFRPNAAAIALASVLMLLALTAVVFASLG
jgi:hypothetical protein